MKIIENQEDHSISIDSETYDRLSKGTNFQRSTNVLGMILQVSDQMTQETLSGWLYGLGLFRGLARGGFEQV